jgi:hypothetical protein
MPEVIGKQNLPTIDDFEEGAGEVTALFREFVYLKKNIDDLSKRQDVIKKKLSEFVDAYGDEDDKGHKWYDMAEVDGYAGMQRQRRVSQKVDHNMCLNLLTDKGLEGRCFEMKPVLNQEEVMKCLYEGLLSEDDLDIMFPKTVTTAFLVTKA